MTDSAVKHMSGGSQSKTVFEFPAPTRTAARPNKPRAWPETLRLYLREQITSARDAREREAAVRLASALVVCNPGCQSA